MTDREKEFPSQISHEVDFFDRASEKTSSFVGHKWWFFIEVMILVLWFPTMFFMKIDTSQLIINTVTTIITFLMVAIIQNTQNRSDQAVHQKLNAITQALGDLMCEIGDGQLGADVDELNAAVGLEKRESS